MEPCVKACRKLGLAIAVNSCGPFWGQDSNEAVEAAAKKYPDTVIPMGFIGLGRGDGPETVEDLHRRGFRGLKMIAPTKDYDDEEFYPVYARAEKLGMPILFHTGVVARADAWLAELKKAGKPLPPHADPRTFNIKSKRMEPMCVEGLGQAFPGLNCIMAHFGSTGRRDVSQGIIQWHPNIYGDLTEFSWSFELDKSERGWHIEERHVKMFKGILDPLMPWKYPHKLLFATDFTTGEPKLLDAMIESHRAVYTAVGIKEADQRKIFRDTAARLLGVE
jgi:hypothetical protein